MQHVSNNKPFYKYYFLINLFKNLQLNILCDVGQFVMLMIRVDTSLFICITINTFESISIILINLFAKNILIIIIIIIIFFFIFFLSLLLFFLTLLLIILLLLL